MCSDAGPARVPGEGATVRRRGRQVEVRRVLKLHAKGEECLLAGVPRGHLPINIAITIASAKDEDVEKCLAKAYERGELKGKAVSRARAVVERRLANGKRGNRGAAHAARTSG